MTVVRGLALLAGAFLGEDWNHFGATADDAIRSFARGQSPEDVEASIAGLQELLASSMSDDELDDRWVLTLGGGYDPQPDGMTYREFFAHALDVLREAAAER